MGYEIGSNCAKSQYSAPITKSPAGAKDPSGALEKMPQPAKIPGDLLKKQVPQFMGGSTLPHQGQNLNVQG